MNEHPEERGEAEQPALPELTLPEDHIRLQMGIGITSVDDHVVGRFSVRPSMWGAGSRRPRLALFALAMDGLSGFLPTPARLPTVDLRAQFSAEPPAEGVVELHGRTLRVGRRIIVSEFTFLDAAGAAFGRGITTMSNNQFDGWVPELDIEPTNPIDSFDRLLGTRIVDERTLELDPSPQISNGVLATPHGGAQMLFCELAAEHLAGRPCAAVDIDTHFLSRGEVGPLQAIASDVGSVGGLTTARVDLVDAGADHALVAAVTVLSRPIG